MHARKSKTAGTTLKRPRGPDKRRREKSNGNQPNLKLEGGVKLSYGEGEPSIKHALDKERATLKKTQMEVQNGFVNGAR